jgi:hypothetical protein
MKKGPNSVRYMHDNSINLILSSVPPEDDPVMRVETYIGK